MGPFGTPATILCFFGLVVPPCGPLSPFYDHSQPFRGTLDSVGLLRTGLGHFGPARSFVSVLFSPHRSLLALFGPFQPLLVSCRTPAPYHTFKMCHGRSASVDFLTHAPNSFQIFFLRILVAHTTLVPIPQASHSRQSKSIARSFRGSWHFVAHEMPVLGSLTPS